MPRSIKSFSQRRSEAERREALSVVTMTERLLALILIELRETRSHRKSAEHAISLQDIGFSKAQAAAILGTTTACLYVLEHRHREAESAPAVAGTVEDGSE